MEQITSRLGHWAVIDIETTGADPSYDQVIDVGFLQFEGTKLVKKFSSLVQYDGELSQFIQKLTGITKKMLIHAPRFSEVENEVQELMGMKLIAHNADFEKSFLEKSFQKISKGINEGLEREEYVDSLYFLSILFPEYSTLKLDHFIREFGLRDAEVHRGYEDSLDLLKVVLVAAALTKADHRYDQFIKLDLLRQSFHEFWMMNFLHLSMDELKTIASQIDFNLEEKVTLAKEKIWPLRFHKEFVEEKRVKPFSMVFSGKNIRDIFEAEEKIKEKFPFYRKREAQIEMSLRVGQSFKNKVHALIQAPTGTGKTFGYLIPAALFALEEKKQVLISTGTKTLQHQAFTKDVPKVKEFLGLGNDDIKIKLLVGSNNHFCESLFRLSENEGALFTASKNFFEKWTSLYFECLFFHNQRVKSEDKILRDDLPFVMVKKNPHFVEKEKEIAVDYRTCTGQLCPHRQSCSYLTDLRESKEANVIIGNHALMLNWPKGNPRPSHIIVDEAHKIEDEATKSYAIEIDERSFKAFVASLGHLQGIGSLFYLLSNNEREVGESTEIIRVLREESLKTHQMLSDHLGPLAETLALYFKKMPKYTEIYWNELPMITKETHHEIEAKKILAHFESIFYLIQLYGARLLPFSDRFEAKSLKSENEITAFTRYQSFFNQWQDYATAFESMLGPSTDFCRTIKFLEAEGFLLSAAPIDIGQHVKEDLLLTTDSVVFTSATLANENGDTGSKGIEWATGYLYLPPEKRFKSGLFLKAQYDYKNKTKVFLCDDMPSLYASEFVSSVIKKMRNLIYDINGRSLILFSARSRFEEARELLLKEFEGKIPLFIQGMGNNVVEDFKAAPHGILLGMESFGEGIDIPGESLQFVFIDKIPDLKMDLVVSERRQFFESRIGNEFTDYYLSHRTRSLHQKLGRLIRTDDDYGGVIIVDNRIKNWKGKTMEKLIRLMAPYELCRGTMDQAVLEIKDFILYPTNHSGI